MTASRPARATPPRCRFRAPSGEPPSPRAPEAPWLARSRPSQLPEPLRTRRAPRPTRTAPTLKRLADRSNLPEQPAPHMQSP